MPDLVEEIRVESSIKTKLLTCKSGMVGCDADNEGADRT
jgi:hypothetical protein